MGAIWYQAIEFANTISELIGHKSGLALSRGEFVDHLNETPNWARLFQLPDDQMIRIRSEEVEALVAELLYRIGNIETSDIRFPGMFHQFKHDRKKLNKYFAIMEDYDRLFREAIDKAVETNADSVDPRRDGCGVPGARGIFH
jgi:restriction system protein